jgi:amino acid transporter
MGTKSLKFFFVIALASVIFLSVNAAVFAQGTILPGSGQTHTCTSPSSCNGDAACKQYCGDYELNDFVGILITVAGWILRISGSLALLAFVLGGVLFLVSAGSSERVNKAKSIIGSAAIGLIIVLTSYMIIGFIFKATGVDPSGTDWSRVSWWQ